MNPGPPAPARARPFLTHPRASVAAMIIPALPDAPADDLWTVAREAFQAGATAQRVCLELGISPTTFWKRASREGWLRRDQPPPPPPIDPGRAVDDLATALDKVWRRICMALDAGDALAAVRWTRIHSQLKADALADRRAEAADRRHAGHTLSLNALRTRREPPRAAGIPETKLEKGESVFPDSLSPDRPPGHGGDP